MKTGTVITIAIVGGIAFIAYGAARGAEAGAATLFSGLGNAGNGLARAIGALDPFTGNGNQGAPTVTLGSDGELHTDHPAALSSGDVVMGPGGILVTVP